MEAQVLIALILGLIQVLIYAGVAYLAFLGLRTLIQSRKTPKQEPPESKSPTGPAASEPSNRPKQTKAPSRRKKPTAKVPGGKKAGPAGAGRGKKKVSAGDED